MKHGAAGWFWLMALVVGFGSPATGRAAQPSDEGYFLSMRQKGQLIWQGEIQDGEGRRYDVWIVPGYAPPARYAETNFRRAGASLKRAGGNLGEYVGSAKYRRLWRNSKRAVRFAFKDCLWDVATDYIPEIWEDAFDSAAERTHKRVFGWWLSYPWAVVKGTLVSAGLAVGGTAVAAVSTASGVVIIPAYHLTDSTVKAAWNGAVDGVAWHGAVKGVALPASAMVINTALAPPLALLGQKPHPDRVDGFWVVNRGFASAVPETSHAAATLKDGTPTAEDLKDLLLLVKSLQTVLQPFAEEQQALDRETRETVAALQRQIRETEQEKRRKTGDITARRKAHLASLGKAESAPDTTLPVPASWPVTRLDRHRDRIIDSIMKDTKLSPSESREWFQTLRAFIAAISP